MLRISFFPVIELCKNLYLLMYHVLFAFLLSMCEYHEPKKQKNKQNKKTERAIMYFKGLIQYIVSLYSRSIVTYTL